MTVYVLYSYTESDDYYADVDIEMITNNLTRAQNRMKELFERTCNDFSGDKILEDETWLSDMDAAVHIEYHSYRRQFGIVETVVE